MCASALVRNRKPGHVRLTTLSAFGLGQVHRGTHRVRKASALLFLRACYEATLHNFSSAAAAAFKTNHAVCSQSDPKSQWFIEPKGGIFCLLPITSVPRPVQSRLCRRSRRPAFHQGSRVRQTGGAFCSVRYVGRDTSFIPSIRLTVRAHSASPISRSSSSETWYTWRRRRYR